MNLKPIRINNKFSLLFRKLSTIPNNYSKFYNTNRLKQKINREPKKVLRAEKLVWLEKNQRLEIQLWSLYNNPGKCYKIFSLGILKKIQKHLADYYKIQTLEFRNTQITFLKERIIRNNLPVEISKLQNIFIESFCFSILSVYITSNSKSSDMAGTDLLYFPKLSELCNKLQKLRLRGSKYFKSSKSFKVKKTLPKRVKLTPVDLYLLKKKLKFKKLNICFKLLRKVNLKSYRNNFVAKPIKRIWISNNNNIKNTFFDIWTLQDRILQQIIIWAILPITEFQADSLSFGFRLQRSAKEAVSYVYNLLSWGPKTLSSLKYLIKQVSLKQYFIFKGKKSRFRSSNLGFNQKRRKHYKYNYYIYPKIKNKKTKNFMLNSYYQILKININQFFNEVSHTSIFRLIPLSNKYFYFVKAWCLVSIFKLKKKKKFYL